VSGTAATHGRSASPNALKILVPVFLGALVAVALGAYGRVHQPTGKAIVTLGFPGLINMKVWLTTFATGLAIIQLLTALRMYGRLGRNPASRRVSGLHRLSGTVAVLLTLPVAYHCLWSLGFAQYNDRVLTHSLLGCGFYGVFVAKMLGLQMRRLPGWALPLLGGLTFTGLIAIWLTSSLWFFHNVGIPAL
jgi:hypothetical protein